VCNPSGGQKSLGPEGPQSEHQPWFFGMRFALLIATWDNYRLPGAFRLIRVKTQPEYQTEHAVFRAMVGRCVPPAWAKRGIVAGDAAYGSPDNMQRARERDADDSARRWGVVCSPWRGRGKRSRIRRSKTW
jgi:hypothetical protein